MEIWQQLTTFLTIKPIIEKFVQVVLEKDDAQKSYQVGLETDIRKN
jgi:hypothetical protein